MWTARDVKDRSYLGVARCTAGLSVLPGLVRLSACGHRPGHAAVREVSNSGVLGVFFTLLATCGEISDIFAVIGAIMSVLRERPWRGTSGQRPCVNTGYIIVN